MGAALHPPSQPRRDRGFVLANGSLHSKTSGEGEIRRKLVEADLVDCIVAMPDKLFFNTGIPVSLWFVSQGPRTATVTASAQGEVLFIDARKLGTMASRRLRELSDDDIQQISSAYHAWRNHDGNFENVAGFVKAATLADIEAHGFVLTPGSYVGTEAVEESDEAIGDKIARLTTELYTEFDRGHQLEAAVRKCLEAIYVE